MRMMALTALVFLSACATSVMQGLVGQNLQQVEAKYGPYANVIDGGAKGKGYQWQLGNTLSGSACYYTLYVQGGVVTSFEEPRAMCE